MLFALLLVSAAPVFDPSAMDMSVDPCTDFYTYACGGWMKRNPIPEDRGAWDMYSKLQEENEGLLRGILEKEKNGQLKDFYAACMDEATIDKVGAEPLQAWLKAIAALADAKTLGRDLAPLLALLHDKTGERVLFGFGPQQDFRDARRVVGSLDQGGLGLPERDYYLKTDAHSKTLREQYLAHVEKMLSLAGDAEAKAHAVQVLAFETLLAKASLSNVERTDSNKLDHWTTLAQLQKLAPAFAWDAYFASSGAKLDDALNVMTPGFFKAVSGLIKSQPLHVWKAYLSWQVVHGEAEVLGKAFTEEQFSFFGRTMRGLKEMQPRYKRCTRMTDALLGELLGKAFVDAYFPGDANDKAKVLVDGILAAMGKRLQALPWMSEGTRKKALEKLQAMRNNIAYPDKWRDYSSVILRPDTCAADAFALLSFEHKRQLAKIGHPVVRGDWQMTPPTVNAYYDPQLNEMNFPAGVLLPPAFDWKGDMAANYGNTGATIGHELTHGFDSDGRHFDAHGNLADWWTKKDAKGFQKRAQCVVDQYKHFVVIDEVHVNSKLTLGENIADLGGTIIALEAYLASDDAKNNEAAWTPVQRFFIAYGQSFCNSVRAEEKRLRAATDPHAPGTFRINGVVANLPEFGAAFSCKPGSPLVRKNACRIW